MKHNHNHDNAQNAGLKLTPVRFEFTSPTAKTVCLAGTFNHWQPEAKTLHSSGVGNWWKETSLAPGTYEYCLVVDGQWMPDPLRHRIRGQSVRREKLDFACGQLAGSGTSGRCGKFTVKKHQQTKTQKYEQTNTSNQQ